MKGCKDCGYASEGTYLKDGRCNECIAKVYQPVQESKMSEKIGAVKGIPVSIRYDFDGMAHVISGIEISDKAQSGLAFTHAQLRQLCANVISSFLEVSGKERVVIVSTAIKDFLASPEFNKALEGLVE